jgi:hypothetical protein
LEERLFDVGHNPFELAQAVSSTCVPAEPKDPKHSCDWAAKFFLDLTNAFALIRGKVKVDYLQGDVVRVLEDIFTAHKKNSMHYIQLSMIVSIPVISREYDEQVRSRPALTTQSDYTGGSLFHYLFTLPLL